jgi:hypothetical protein
MGVRRMFYFLLFFADLFAAASAFAPGPNGAGGASAAGLWRTSRATADKLRSEPVFVPVGLRRGKWGGGGRKRGPVGPARPAAGKISDCGMGKRGTGGQCKVQSAECRVNGETAQPSTQRTQSAEQRTRKPEPGTRNGKGNGFEARSVPTRNAERGTVAVQSAECRMQSERRNGTAFNAENAENAEGGLGNGERQRGPKGSNEGTGRVQSAECRMQNEQRTAMATARPPPQAGKIGDFRLNGARRNRIYRNAGGSEGLIEAGGGR